MYNVQEKPKQILVKFWCNVKSKYDDLMVRDPSTIYFCSDTLEIYKGNTCYSGSVKVVPFLPKEYRKDTLYIIIDGDYAGGYIYPQNGYKWEKIICGDVFKVSNILKLEDIPIVSDTVDGLLSHEDKITYDTTTTTVAALVEGYPVTIESVVDSDLNTVYTFKQGPDVIGEISLPRIDLLDSGSVVRVEPNAIKYNGRYLPAGRYIKLTFTSENVEDMYISLADLDSLYTAGDGIKIEDNVISLNIDKTTGLEFRDNGKLALNLDQYLGWRDFPRR